MGSGRRMCWVRLWLMTFLAFSSEISPTAGSPMRVISSPNLLRVGTEEKIFVEIQDPGDRPDLDVKIYVKNHPTKTRTLTSTTVRLTKDGNFQGFGKITIPASEFIRNSKAKQYVTLQADFDGTILEKVVLVSFQSGYIFIQTDKPIYTPSSTVKYRVFAVRPGMDPVEKDSQQGAETSITVNVMTPDDITIQSDTVSMTTGLYSGDYKLSDIVRFGQWKVVAKFQSSTEETFTAEFEVKEYVLPSFEVKILPPPETPFFYVDSDSLTFTIKATYVFGEEVDGSAYVVFGLMQGDTKNSFPRSLQRIPIQRGRGEVTLRKEAITHTFPNINDLEGNSIYVAVSVLTSSGSEMVEAELRGIKIVKSPYKIHFTKSPKHFKPGMSFDVMVEVTNPDESPAQNIVVTVEPGGLKADTRDNGLARFTINTVEDTQSLTVTARTDHPQIAAHRQASASMVAHPYRSSSSSYIHMSVNSAEVELGENMKVNFNLNRPESQQNDLTYLILSRGQIVQYNRYEINRRSQFSLMVKITKEMLPSFRMVAYYHKSSNELVSDSIWVDVKDTCMGKLKLEIIRPLASYEPRKSFKLKLTGDPEATVGLVAVDKSVFVLNNKNRLTQKKIWDVVEQYDTGCAAGGGRDNMHVFYDAGLLLETTFGGTPERTDVKCSAARRKREVTIIEVRTSLVSDYKDKLPRECCLDGMRDLPVSYTCERRSQYIVDGAACKEAFLHCCKEMQRHREEKKEEVQKLARSEKDDGYKDRSEISTRTNFPESWLWNDIPLPACPQETPNCETTSYETIKPLPDSITTWQLTAVSLSKTNGICVASPVEVIVFKPFFIDLRLPYSAVRGEQLEVKAVLHNYNIDPITVRVELKEDPNMCSAAYKKGWFQQEVVVGGQTTRPVALIIIPMKNGHIPIEVKASVKNSHLADGIMKKLLVVPQGVLVQSIRKLALDPAKKGVAGKQVETINSDISTVDLVPDTPRRTTVSLTGIEQISTLLDNAISGESMGTLIKEPKGCGEQNIAAMTLPVIAALYLDKTNQWESVGFEKRNKAINHMKKGYENELGFRNDDGSFAIFKGSKSTTWLTAYVPKVFALAYNFVNMDSSVICGAIKYLILNTQQPDGMFVEIGEVWDKGMIGDVGGVDSDASMTAFCLIAMQESRTICSASINSLPNSMQKAVTYLEGRLPRLRNSYAVALTSYALANENKLNKAILYNFAASDRSHWPVNKGHIYTLEATAYALLALVKAGAFEEAKPVVRWLGQQQKVGGGYGSTQATIMVYQAVAEYSANVKEPPFDLNVDLAIQGRSLIEKVNFNHQNHYATRTSKFDGINKDVKVTATGTGEAIFNMVSLYYALPSKQESDCEKFDLNLQLLPEKIEADERIYKLRIDVMFKNKVQNASMSILDIGLPTGYIFNQNDLELLSTGHDRIIQKYETDKVLSEKGSLIIYLNTISNMHPEEISFRIHQTMKVGVLQPAAVSVYEYYNRKPCVKFYRPERQSGELLRLCQDDECVCAEENCSKQRKEKISNDDRTTKACESTETSKIDFVYKVQVENFYDNYTTDIHTVRVLKVMKEGNTDRGSLGKLRTFLTYQHCREALGLASPKTYLIMGSSSDIHIRRNSFQYVLNENTWVEYWPTAHECQDPTYRPTCLGIDELIEQFEVFGCQMK